MVVQKTINNLKGGSKDEKTAVASGGAVLVVIILLLGYGLWFASNIKRGGQFNTTIESRPQNGFLPPAVRDAERVLQNTMRRDSEELRELRDTAVDIPLTLQNGGGEEDAFNLPNVQSNF
jgi:hypothetical protein